MVPLLGYLPSPSLYTRDLPSLDYSSASPASSSSDSRQGSTTDAWPWMQHDSLPTPVDNSNMAGDYFGFVPSNKPQLVSTPYVQSWEVVQPQPQRFPSSYASTSLLLTPNYFYPSHVQSALPSPALSEPTPSKVAEQAKDDLEDVVFATRYPAPKASGQLLSLVDNQPVSHDVGVRNKQACVFCQSGRRKCDGNKNDLSGCSVCASTGRQCCWTKVKRLRGPNRARGVDGKPAVSSAALRVRPAGTLLRRIEHSQRQARAQVAPPSIVRIEESTVGADGWEATSSDGFQVSSDFFDFTAPSYSYPATPRRQTQELPLVIVPAGCATTCGLATPFDEPSFARIPSPKERHDAEVKGRLARFTFPLRAVTPLPSTPSHPCAFELVDPHPQHPRPTKRQRAEDDDDLPPATRGWLGPSITSNLSPGEKMNAKLNLGHLNGQRLDFRSSDNDLGLYL